MVAAYKNKDTNKLSGESGSVNLSVGYDALVDMYELNVIPNWHSSTVLASSGVMKTVEDADGRVRQFFPRSYYPGDSAVNHLEFALKYDGVNLAILAQVFKMLPVDELAEYIRSAITGKYTRRVWFLYEFLTDEIIPVNDATSGNYVDLLDSDNYYTILPRKVKRQRINNNMMGDRDFCPVVRRTSRISEHERQDYSSQHSQIISEYSDDILTRAVNYMYHKETKSSFAIEHENPPADRVKRFMRLLQEAATEDFCNKERLVQLQNQIVDSRFAENGYRTVQNYVGQSMLGYEKVHFVCPKPEDLPTLMDSLIRAHCLMKDGSLHPVVHAAVVSYGFVFLHPFEDGNGRIHRFLLHNIMALRGFTPTDAIFPVSAAIMADRNMYDGSLADFSGKLEDCVEYDLDDEGKMSVKNATANWYRYIDMTVQVETLFLFIQRVINDELKGELEFIVSYDKAKLGIQRIVDMKDSDIDLFIKLCLQNKGVLAKRKRASHFVKLTADEITRMEQVVRDSYSI